MEGFEEWLGVAPPVRWAMTEAGVDGAAAALPGPSRSLATSYRVEIVSHIFLMDGVCVCDATGDVTPLDGCWGNLELGAWSLEEVASTYPNVIFEFYTARGIETDFFEGCADGIVGLALAGLGGLDGGGLVNVPLIVYVELAEGIGQAEDVALL